VYSIYARKKKTKRGFFTKKVFNYKDGSCLMCLQVKIS
jgi:hypothetical protein